MKNLVLFLTSQSKIIFMESPFTNYTHPPKINIIEEKKDSFIWNIQSLNGEILLESKKSFPSRKDCIQDLEIIGNGIYIYFEKKRATA